MAVTFQLSGSDVTWLRGCCVAIYFGLWKRTDERKNKHPLSVQKHLYSEVDLKLLNMPSTLFV